MHRRIHWIVILLVSAFVSVSTTFAQTVIINEIMSSNATTKGDASGEYADWIELYNATLDTIDLGGYGLSDNYSEPYKWIFPSITVAPAGHLLVWASGKDSTDAGGELHTNFKIKAEGEELLLTHPDGTRIQDLSPVSIATDVSYGRYPEAGPEWYLFDNPTPGSRNSSVPHRRDLVEPGFSHGAGFYTESFSLEITSPDTGTTIYYTLDGSVPNTSSLVHSEPIGVSSRAGDPNTISMIQTSDITPDHVLGGNWQPPVGEVFKTTCVRAKAMRNGFQESPITTRTFFVDESMNSRYTMPIISLTTDADNFFRDDIGIYVPGDGWTYWVPGTFDNKRFYAANFWQRGSQWERPVHMEFFEPGGTLGFASDAGIRTHGGWMRRSAHKSLRLYSRGGTNGFNYQIFPDRNLVQYEQILLRQEGPGRTITLFRDGLVHSLLETSNLTRQQWRPSIVFLNGEYWGVHNLRDRIEETHLEIEYGVDGDNLDLLEWRFRPSIASGDNIHYEAMLSYFRWYDIALPQHYEHITTMMDIENFIDYHIYHIYIADTDWGANNIKCWRLRTDAYDPDAPYGHDGRWRWLLYDTEMGFDGDPRVIPGGGIDHFTLRDAINNPSDYRPTSILLSELITNVTFRKAFVSRFADLLNTVFRPEWVVPRIDELQAIIAPEIAEHIARWSEQESVGAWEQEVETMRSFARERPSAQWQHLVSYFNGKPLPLTVNVSDPLRGVVKVNSVLVDAETPGVVSDTNGSVYPWTGNYLSSIPVTLVAQPKPGYHFAGWAGLEGTIAEAHADDDSVVVMILGDFTVTAVFTDAASVESKDRPFRYALSRNVPNPFNPTTRFQFSLASDGLVQIAVYDVTGRRVRILVNGDRRSGHHSVMWDGRDGLGRSVASGVYIIRMTAGEFVTARKVTLLR
jgi:hypothetical protein